MGGQRMCATLARAQCRVEDSSGRPRAQHAQQQRCPLILASAWQAKGLSFYTVGVQVSGQSSRVNIRHGHVLLQRC